MVSNGVVEWSKRFPSVQLWFEGIGIGTRDYYLRTFYEFCTEGLKSDSVLAGFSPEQLLDFQENAVGRERHRILSCAQVFIQRQTLRLGTKRTNLSAIRSFFQHGHCDLPMDRGFRLRSDVAPVCGHLSVEDLRKILFKCNDDYRAVFLTMFQGGMGEAELVYVNENLSGFIIDEIRSGKRRIRLTLPGRKLNRNVKPYATMIGKDAIDSIKAIMQFQSKNGVLFVNEFGRPITKVNIMQYFHAICLRVGVIKPKARSCKACGSDAFPLRQQLKGDRRVHYECKSCGALTPASDYDLTPQEYGAIRYDFGAHELRDTFKSEVHYSGADLQIADFCMGHEVDPLLYDKVMVLHPEFLEEQYRIAEPYLNILSEDPRKLSRSEVADQLGASRLEVEALKRDLKSLQLSDEDRVFLSKKTEILDALDRITKIEKKLSDTEIC